MTKLVKNIDSEPVNCETEECFDEDDCYNAFYSKEAKVNGPYTVELSCNGKPIQVEVDTGASCTLMARATLKTYKAQWRNRLSWYPTRSQFVPTQKRRSRLGVHSKDISHKRDKMSPTLR